MICPSCNNKATSFLRNAFSSQGVSTSRSMQGYLKCQQCGTFLRVIGYKKYSGFFIGATVVLLVLYALLYQQLFLTLGLRLTVILWLFLVLLTFTTYIFMLWKYGKVQKVDTDIHSI